MTSKWRIRQNDENLISKAMYVACSWLPISHKRRSKWQPELSGSFTVRSKQCGMRSTLTSVPRSLRIGQRWEKSGRSQLRKRRPLRCSKPLHGARFVGISVSATIRERTGPPRSVWCCRFSNSVSFPQMRCHPHPRSSWTRWPKSRYPSAPSIVLTAWRTDARGSSPEESWPNDSGSVSTRKTSR